MFKVLDKPKWIKSTSNFIGVLQKPLRVTIYTPTFFFNWPVEFAMKIFRLTSQIFGHIVETVSPWMYDYCQKNITGHLLNSSFSPLLNWDKFIAPLIHISQQTDVAARVHTGLLIPANQLHTVAACNRLLNWQEALMETFPRGVRRL